jgi:hypothetical protein
LDSRPTHAFYLNSVPLASATQQVKTLIVQSAYQAGERVVVVVACHGDNTDIGCKQLLYAPLKGPIGFIHFVFGVYDVPRKDNGVHIAVDRSVDKSLPNVADGEHVILGRHAGRAAAKMHVASAEKTERFHGWPNR